MIKAARKSIWLAAALLLTCLNLMACAGLDPRELREIGTRLTPHDVDFRSVRYFAGRAHAAYLTPDEIRRLYPDTVRVASPKGTDVQYFVEQSLQSKTQTVSIRGTVDFNNIMEDIDFSVETDSKASIPLHRGFSLLARRVYGELKPHLNPAYKTRLTGHSLGAAIASIIMLYMIEDGFPVERMVNFGQPKFTNAAGVARYKHLPVVRIVDENDVIPLFPPTTILDPVHGAFEHLGAEVILLKDQYFVYLNEHDATRLSVGEFWRNIKYATLKDHAMNRYTSRIASKLEQSEQVAYADRERYTQ